VFFALSVGAILMIVGGRRSHRNLCPADVLGS
jgi:hypothetical protein